MKATTTTTKQLTIHAKSTFTKVTNLYTYTYYLIAILMFSFAYKKKVSRINMISNSGIFFFIVILHAENDNFISNAVIYTYCHLCNMRKI